MIEIGKARNSRRGDTALKRKMPMRFSLVAAVLPALFVDDEVREEKKRSMWWIA